MPLRHDPGHAQVDFGEALAEIAGVERKIHFFAMDLPHSDACFVRAHPAETAEAFELSAPPCGNRRERAFPRSRLPGMFRFVVGLVGRLRRPAQSA